MLGTILVSTAAMAIALFGPLLLVRRDDRRVTEALPQGWMPNSFMANSPRADPGAGLHEMPSTSSYGVILGQKDELSDLGMPERVHAYIGRPGEQDPVTALDEGMTECGTEMRLPGAARGDFVAGISRRTR